MVFLRAKFLVEYIVKRAGLTYLDESGFDLAPNKCAVAGKGVQEFNVSAEPHHVVLF